MKISAISFTSFLIGAYTTSYHSPVADAACPFAGMHGMVANPHSSVDDTLGAANERSMKATRTPLIHFKVPPKDRNPETTYVEGGLLMEKDGPHKARTPEERKRQLQDLTGSAMPDPAYSNQHVGDGGIPEGGYGAVRQAVIDMVLTNDEGYWPADFPPPAGPNYGGLFMRLAWHCNGTYRRSDGRGGCDGAGIRFPPVSQWEDNGSLNMALELLKPVKDKFGSDLSWGDLIVLAADASMESMGGPVIGFCGGRIDWSNGDQDLPLGPSVIQNAIMPCGEGICPTGEICPHDHFGCKAPLGSAAVGLIYVDPTGSPLGEFEGTANNIREVFGRMGFNDRMTVAAIGGGHAFGKCHGPCPRETLVNICDESKFTEVATNNFFDTQLLDDKNKDRSLNEYADAGHDNVKACHSFCPDPDLDFVAYAGNPNISDSKDGPWSWTQKWTSGLEVTWTQNPTQWDNEYFHNLFDYEWVNVTGPAGNLQWKPKNQAFPQMLTTDLALAYGDKDYEKLSIEYRDSFENLTTDFGMAWYQLMSRDVGPRTRCLGDELPPIQPWEEEMGPLVPLSTDKPDYVPIRSAIQKSIDDEPSNLAHFATLAYQCASTFRATDYLGGCNGAAIRFSPQIDWEVSDGAYDSLKLLEPIKDEFPEISWSDLIVLAGMTSVEAAGGLPMPFCGGRVDSDDGTKSMGMEPQIFNNNTYDTLMYDIANKGLALAEGVALMATPDPILPSSLWGDNADAVASARAASLNSTSSSNYTSMYALSNQFFVNAMASDDPIISELFADDMADIAEQFINNNDYFLEQYGKAYNYMMTADLFDGPTRNACQGVSDPTLEGQTASPTPTPEEPSIDDASTDTTNTTDDSADDDSASSSIASVSGTFFAILAAASPWMMA